MGSWSWAVILMELGSHFSMSYLWTHGARAAKHDCVFVCKSEGGEEGGGD